MTPFIEYGAVASDPQDPDPMNDDDGDDCPDDEPCSQADGVPLVSQIIADDQAELKRLRGLLADCRERLRAAVLRALVAVLPQFPSWTEADIEGMADFAVRKYSQADIDAAT